MTVRLSILLMSLTLVCAGCGRGNVQVSGQLVFPDGTPVKDLKGGDIAFELIGENYSAISFLDEEGRFNLFSIQPGDGLKRGKYRVAIKPLIPVIPDRDPNDPNARPPVLPPPYPLNSKYQSVDTSGLELEVKSGEKDLKLTVEPAA